MKNTFPKTTPNPLLSNSLYREGFGVFINWLEITKSKEFVGFLRPGQVHDLVLIIKKY